MNECSKILTLYPLQKRDYSRHPLLIKAINDKSFKINIFDLSNILKFRKNHFYNESMPPKNAVNISYIKVNSLIYLINLIPKKDYSCLFRVPKIFTKTREFIILFIIAFLFKNLIFYDLNPSPEFLLFNKNYKNFIKQKFAFLKEKSKFYYYSKYFAFILLKFFSDIIHKQLKYKNVFVSGAILEEYYKSFNVNVKITRTASFDYKKFKDHKYYVSQEKKFPINNNCKNLYYIDGGHINHKDQEYFNKKQDCDEDSWEKLLNSLFNLYAKEGYKITIFKHPNLNSDFYKRQNVNIKSNIYDLLTKKENNDLIICSSGTLSILIPFFNYDFIFLFDESITKSKLNTEVIVLKKLFPKNTFIKNEITELFNPSKINNESLNNLKDFFLE